MPANATITLTADVAPLQAALDATHDLLNELRMLAPFHARLWHARQTWGHEWTWQRIRHVAWHRVAWRATAVTARILRGRR